MLAVNKRLESRGNALDGQQQANGGTQSDDKGFLR